MSLRYCNVTTRHCYNDTIFQFNSVIVSHRSALTASATEINDKVLRLLSHDCIVNLDELISKENEKRYCEITQKKKNT